MFASRRAYADAAAVDPVPVFATRHAGAQLGRRRALVAFHARRTISTMSKCTSASAFRRVALLAFRVTTSGVDEHVYSRSQPASLGERVPVAHVVVTRLARCGIATSVIRPRPTRSTRLLHGNSAKPIPSASTCAGRASRLQQAWWCRRLDPYDRGETYTAATKYRPVDPTDRTGFVLAKCWAACSAIFPFSGDASRIFGGSFCTRGYRFAVQRAIRITIPSRSTRIPTWGREQALGNRFVRGGLFLFADAMMRDDGSRRDHVARQRDRLRAARPACGLLRMLYRGRRVARAAARQRLRHRHAAASAGLARVAAGRRGAAPLPPPGCRPKSAPTGRRCCVVIAPPNRRG